MKIHEGVIDTLAKQEKWGQINEYISAHYQAGDIDQDNDLEIISGTTGDVIIYDIKESSSLSDYWNIYKGNNHRDGFYEYNSQCSPGDINFDTVINILDIVTLVNIVVNFSNISEDEFCAADLNSDSTINILDIVTLVNIIISSDV